jgi:leucyl-tRNA synthetase
LQYRLTYLAETEVNWCPGLGTVLANDEIVNGVSERGGFPVIRKKMTQWSMRISAYAERLLQGLNTIDWSESMKESQRNWIGKSVGALVSFPILTINTNSEENTNQLLDKAEELRANPAETEHKLWQSLKSKALDYIFKPQYLIGDYIVDFVCLSKKLVIVINEETQDFQQVNNIEREKVIAENGFKIIRFNKEEILRNIAGVLDTITQELDGITGSASENKKIEVFTTRPDTIFGVTFMTLAPEHELVVQITTTEQKGEVDAYIEKTAKRSERERMADVKTISGVFTGAYAEHPFTKEPIPVWIGDYVLAGYGTGAVMAVPCGDERDYAFANFFRGNPKTMGGMPEIKNIFANVDISKEAYGSKDNVIIDNSDFLNGLNYKEATKKVIEELEKLNQGKGKINYRLRDAVFSRQRYWGEPFPVYYVNGLPQMIDAKHLPIILPEVEKYLPTEDGLPPLGNAATWAWDSAQCSVVSTQLIDNLTIFPLELNTMPGWAGSSWYWMRYMDAKNENEFASSEALVYWNSVDLYIGGSEHATGHLLYSRFWNKFLKDKGFAPTEEPFKKLINQGMILGMSAFVYRLDGTNTYVSKNKTKGQKVQPIHVDVSMVNTSDELDIKKFKKSREDYNNAEFICEDNGNYIVGREIEKMSKSKYNVVTPDDICNEYGADTLRLYEMFLGPLEQAKPWNTAGISGVFGFLKKLWRLYFDDNGLIVTNNKPSKDSLKSLHKTIKKVAEDIEGFSFNTSVSQFMICVNELSTQRCHERAILEPLTILISSYAPHIAEELWSQLGNTGSVSTVAFPILDEKNLVESSKEYPVSFNGKMRFTIELPLDLSKEQIEEIIMKDERTLKQLDGKTPNKIIIVPGKVINLVG